MKTSARIVLALGLVLILAGLAAPWNGDETREIVSISKKDFVAHRLAAGGLDLLMEKDGRVYIVATPGDVRAISAAGITLAFETLRFLPSPATAVSPAGGLNGAYHSYPELESDLRLLETSHPELAKLFEIGTSLEGRKVYALKISRDVALDEHKPAVMILGCHHAREWISLEVPFLYGKYLLENYGQNADVQNIVNTGETWVVPLVNPDGLEYSIHVYRYWRKNRRLNADGTYGVDINRNYGYQWGFDNLGSSPAPGSEAYRGTSAFSEPETEAVRRLFLSRDFRASISYHSFSQTILYPWGYVDQPTPTDAGLATAAQAMAGLIAAVRGTVYAYGRGAAVLYLTNGDLNDWTYGVSGIPSFTIELPPVDILHGGFFNAESDIDGIFRENLPAALYLSSSALQGTALQPGPSKNPGKRPDPAVRIKFRQKLTSPRE